MMLNLKQRGEPVTGYIPDVIGYNFSRLWPQPVRRSARGFAGLHTLRYDGFTSKAGRTSMSAVHTYCADKPPTPDTVAMLEARGDTIVYTQCAGTASIPGTEQAAPNPGAVPVVNPTGFTQAAADWYSGGAPNIAPPPPCAQSPLLKYCEPWDAGCAAENAANETNQLNSCQKQQADYQRSLCEANWQANAPRYQAAGMQVPPDTCSVQWPAGYALDRPATDIPNPELYINPATETRETMLARTGYYGGPAAAVTAAPASQQQASAVTNQPNQSVPPRTPINLVPGVQTPPSAADRLSFAYHSGDVQVSTPGGGNTWLLLAAGVGLLLMMRK